jgi:hypothetical protein
MDIAGTAAWVLPFVRASGVLAYPFWKDPAMGVSGAAGDWYDAKMALAKS